MFTLIIIIFYTTEVGTGVNWNHQMPELKCGKFNSVSLPATCFFLLLQPTTKLFINGKFVESKTDRWIDNLNPVSEITNQQYSSVA
jgi:hypothetical protein